MSKPDRSSVPSCESMEWLSEIQEAPHFRPTVAEWAEPMAYLSRIQAEAGRCGICVIESPLCADTPASQILERLRFSTRTQRLGGVGRADRAYAETSREYSLQSFARASFEAALAGGIPGCAGPVGESERRYWRAHGDRRSAVVVEYGNDVEGSGFAGPEDPLGGSTWNLRRLAREPGSVLARIANDVPGIVSPLLYIGQAQSTFAWHVEDHNLYSINYSHAGEAKIWYSVPATHAAALEAVASRVIGEADRSRRRRRIARSMAAAARVRGARREAQEERQGEDEEEPMPLCVEQASSVLGESTLPAEPDELPASLEAYATLDQTTARSSSAAGAPPLSPNERAERGREPAPRKLAEARACLAGKTLMFSPERLVAAGVPVFRAVHRPGCFVVTFPEAYHAGFSTGFNFGEAVNFALGDWWAYGEAARRGLRAQRRAPILDHERLLHCEARAALGVLQAAEARGRKDPLLRSRPGGMEGSSLRSRPGGTEDPSLRSRPAVAAAAAAATTFVRHVRGVERCLAALAARAPAATWERAWEPCPARQARQCGFCLQVCDLALCRVRSASGRRERRCAECVLERGRVAPSARLEVLLRSDWEALRLLAARLEPLAARAGAAATLPLAGSARGWSWALREDERGGAEARAAALDWQGDGLSLERDCFSVELVAVPPPGARRPGRAGARERLAIRTEENPASKEGRRDKRAIAADVSTEVPASPCASRENPRRSGALRRRTVLGGSPASSPSSSSSLSASPSSHSPPAEGDARKGDVEGLGLPRASDAASAQAATVRSHAAREAFSHVTRVAALPPARSHASQVAFPRAALLPAHSPASHLSHVPSLPPPSVAIHASPAPQSVDFWAAHAQASGLVADLSSPFCGPAEGEPASPFCQPRVLSLAESPTCSRRFSLGRCEDEGGRPTADSQPPAASSPSPVAAKALLGTARRGAWGGRRRAPVSELRSLDVDLVSLCAGGRRTRSREDVSYEWAFQ